MTKVELEKVVRNLRHRADTAGPSHSVEWANGVRFAANQIEEAIAKKTPKAPTAGEGDGPAAL